MFQLAIDLADATKRTGTGAANQAMRRTPGGGRYVLTDVVAGIPAMFDMTRLDQGAGLGTATLGEVVCIASA